MNFIIDVLKILADVANGVMSPSVAQEKIAALDAADAVVDLEEMRKLGLLK